ncbi:pro-resilin-like [Penaeus monodon]|uniref:pro-resilin-like n=1 Tax=Penaeus monodon TaxID=6687 RepID=UPI0018A72FAB|nr:pro-resilin-like [Penaeus monodon]
MAVNRGQQRRPSEEPYESGEAKYDFQWTVDHEDSGINYGHQEARDGEDTQGSYYVHLPDGRLQTVRFVVEGDDGYVTDVNYDGKARFPDSYESASFESRDYSYFYDTNESK